jgi:hypothetical protein
MDFMCPTFFTSGRAVFNHGYTAQAVSLVGATRKLRGNSGAVRWLFPEASDI